MKDALRRRVVRHMTPIVLEFANVNMIASRELLEAVLAPLPVTEEAMYNVEVWVRTPGYYDGDGSYAYPTWLHTGTHVMQLPEQYKTSLFGELEDVIIRDLRCLYTNPLYRIVVTPSTNAGAGHKATWIGDPD